jgi:thiamine-monophosphate kinase
VRERELIQTFTRPFGVARAPRGPGDDCAVLPPSRGELCVTTDAVVEGVHFTRRHFTFEDVGHKALAVNLSDLAAMGARPSWFLCALGLPARTPDGEVQALGRGMSRLARASGIALAGGNVTRAREWSVTLTCAGEVPPGRALLRGGAGAGDLLYVSGTLGDARLGLARLGTRRCPEAQARQRRPSPRLALGLLARPFASACIDLSDGLATDLVRLSEASQLGARLEVERLPLSAELSREMRGTAWRWALGGGEDYELLLAISARRAAGFERACRSAGERVTQIGRLTAERGVRCLDGDDRPVRAPAGFGHFSGI